MLLIALLLPGALGLAQSVQRYVKQFGPAEGLTQPDIYALLQDRAGYLWLGTAQGLLRFDGNSFMTFTARDGLAENFVTALTEEPSTGALWVGHRGGSVSRRVGRQFSVVPAGTAGPLRARRGLPRPDTARLEQFRRRFQLRLPPETVLTALLRDREGTYWLATAGRGLWRLTDAHVAQFPLPVGDAPTTLAPATGGAVAGTVAGRLVALQATETQLQMHTRVDSVGAGVTALTPEHGTPPSVAVGTGGRGVWRLPTAPGAPAAYRQLPANLRVTSLSLDPQLGLWVGTAGRGAYWLRATDTVATHFTPANGLLHNDVTVLLADRAGRVWFGTHGSGLAVREADGHFRSHRLMPSGVSVASLYEDAAGRVWVGTEGDGLFCFETNRLRHYTTQQGLPNSYCYGFAPLPGGGLLLVHRNGLSQLRGGVFRALSTPDNPLVRECRANAALAQPDGAVLLATRTGLLRVVAPTAGAAASPGVAITAAEVDDFMQPSTELGQLDAGRHRIVWQFRVPSLAPASTWQYQYRLQGFDDQWSQPSPVGEAHFPQLDAGRYVLEVRARQGFAGPWGAPAAVEFAIATPFWRTGWFKLLGALAVAAGIFVFVRAREGSWRKQKDQLETAVRERTRQLRRQKARLADMNAELVEARDAAEASRRAKAQFLANMSHEIRTPMNAVIGLTHLLRQTRPTPEQLEYLTAVQSSSENLLVILNDILDSSKIEAGKLTLEQTPFRLGELLRRVTNLFRFSAEAKNLYLRLDVSPDVPEAVVGDQVRLNQVLANLLNNAVKFTAEGGVTLRVTATPGAEAPHVLVHFAIEDTGIGIAPGQLDAIFEDFAQASADNTRRFGGAGLGLSIARHLVQLHGGHLSVHSEENRGSTFSFDLPYQAADPATVPAEYDETTGRFEPALHVLLAEDNELNQLVARKTLEAWNVQVTVAANGRLAVEAAEHDAFDAVLMDVQMPEMDGYEAARQLRARFPDAGRLPILALTASALPEDRVLAEAAGMNDTLTKPFDPAVLFARLAYFTGRTVVAAEPAEPAQAAPTPPPADAEPTPTEPVPPADGAAAPLRPDWTLLEELAGGNDAFLQQIVRTFLTQAPQLHHQLSNALACHDFDGLARTAHKLKGQVAYFGLPTLRATLETLERPATATAEPDELVPQVGELLDLVYPQLRARVGA